MYEFVTGPLVWISFGIFIVGMIYKIISLIRLTYKKDKVVFNHFSVGWSINSIIHWLIPFGSRGMRERPAFTILTFVFHICLLATPIFLLAHNMLWESKWNISWWSMSEGVADYMTILFILAAIGMACRRIAYPDVRIVTTSYDFVMLAIVAAPFITGYFASHHWFHYKTMLIIHVLCGEIMLITIPFSKLSHMLLFLLTRAHIASEMGQRRGAVTW